nr:proline-rich receptor-like protein kinase PERK10 [Lolium perenne]
MPAWNPRVREQLDGFVGSGNACARGSGDVGRAAGGCGLIYCLSGRSTLPKTFAVKSFLFRPESTNFWPYFRFRDEQFQGVLGTPALPAGPLRHCRRPSSAASIHLRLLQSPVPRPSTTSARCSLPSVTQPPRQHPHPPLPRPPVPGHRRHQQPLPRVAQPPSAHAQAATSRPSAASLCSLPPHPPSGRPTLLTARHQAASNLCSTSRRMPANLLAVRPCSRISSSSRRAAPHLPLDPATPALPPTQLAFTPG